MSGEMVIECSKIILSVQIDTTATQGSIIFFRHVNEQCKYV